MAAPNYDALVAWLREEYGDDLRWVASFDHRKFSYRVRQIRDDLRNDLSEQELETIVHRTMAVFNRPHVEDVHFHLGDASCLIVQHERATAVHVYLDDHRGVMVKIEPDAGVTVPGFAESCLDRLGVEP